MALPYRGGAIPLAWTTWAQNTAQPDGAYWAAIDQVLAEAAARLPPERPVIVLADRAYAVPNFLDRLTARGWHWIVRITTTGAHRFQARQGPAVTDVGPDQSLAEHLARVLPGPGHRWGGSGRFAKKAGWRAVNVVAVWGRTAREPLVVITDLPPRWDVLCRYRRRFWIEAGFRADKSAGWHWEQSQVRDPAHHQVLLLALAWATLLALCTGAARAETQLQTRPAHHASARRVRQSLFRLGVRALRHHAVPLHWALPKLFGPTWAEEWRMTASRCALLPQPVRP